MTVPAKVRAVESQIDASIHELPIWQAPRAQRLEQLMHIYRDALDLVFRQLVCAQILDSPPEDFGVGFGFENRTRGGVLWALKWASEYCPESGQGGIGSPEELVRLIYLGTTYEAFVDALKYAQRGLLTIQVDESSRIITCYEGGNVTAFDVPILQQGQLSTPMMPHVPLTEDGDQLTSRWTAGDYRRVTRMLADYAASQESEIHADADFLAQIGRPEVPEISVGQPTVVWLHRPSMAPDCHVFDDLVLPTRIDSQLKWKLVSLLETPIVKIGDRYCALSSDLKAIAMIDDYMLRLAVRVDEQQYSLVSGLREHRMITTCRHILEHCSPPWIVTDRVRFMNPSQEADLVAARGRERLVLELKATLRPETPWEVYKRNEDIIGGIKHTRSLIDRGAAGQGFVITDGYRGDYTCWAEALTHGIPIATLYDLAVIAHDPVAAVPEIKRRVGIMGSTLEVPERLPDREEDLLNWKLRCIDRDAPEETRH
jgi:hypothetical protein